MNLGEQVFSPHQMKDLYLKYAKKLNFYNKKKVTRK